ncbi:MAG: SpoIID/LytB domain-containing protein [Ferrimicrobium sp.]
MKRYQHSIRHQRRAVRSLRYGVMLAAGAVAGAAPGFVVAGSNAYASTLGMITVSGFGVGSGVGASQYGEAGYAISGELTYQQILAHYYGGTTLTTQADRTVAVYLTGSTNTPAVVYSPSGLVVNGTSVSANTEIQVSAGTSGWSIQESTGGVSACGQSVSWTQILGGQSGVTITPAQPMPLGSMTAETSSQALVWCSLGGAGEAVRGNLLATKNSTGQQVLVNQVGLQSYVRGVIAREMPASWATLGSAGPQGQPWGFQALEAQAIEVRSYVLANLGGYGFADICDTSSCQVYGGLNNLGAPYASYVAQAVADTANQVVVLANGQVADTQYSASDGGYTAGGSFPPVVDTYDSQCVAAMCNPYHSWSNSISLSSIEAAFPSIGSVTGLVVNARNGYGIDGGRVTSITINGTSGSVALSGLEFAFDFGLFSDWFTLSGPVAIVNDSAVVASSYVIASTDGGVAVGGGAANLGSTYTYGITGLSGSRPLNAPIVGIASTPGGGGYWMVAADGGVFNFGDAGFFGSTYTYGITGLSGSRPLNAPIVGIASTPGGGGYWMVAADGGVFNFGDAGFFGSTGGQYLASPVVGIASTPDGRGYWLVQANGGVIPFGDAQGYGSLVGLRLNKPVVGIVATADGRGYWMVAADGGVFNFGDAGFYGSLGGSRISSPAISLIPGPNGDGYSVALADGQIVGFGNGVSAPSLGAATTGHGYPVVGVIP